MPWSVRMSIALDIAKGLAYLHSKGMFHRDLTSKVSHLQRILVFFDDSLKRIPKRESNFNSYEFYVVLKIHIKLYIVFLLVECPYPPRRRNRAKGCDW